MFDVPFDAWYAWLGVALASVAVFGTAWSLPATPPPDAAGVADTVDSVAASDHPTTAEHPLEAATIELGPHRLELRNDGGAAHATFAFGPVTPVGRGSRLEAVLYGTPPERAFASPEAFKQALIEARTREPTRTSVERTLVARRVSWEGVDATLVGA
ncbi:DUF7283 family protein [Halegenticoccus tardaugens]|uniref:DUF7283 family protein n=1 Tax=Halegenticoccus tardaugens TaxID=2071624 RepID=UPI00100B3752|nr:hypothetical protein [Halegenticoccus tardaugens]